MDRFNSNEDSQEWDEQQFDAGQQARRAGAPREAAPEVAGAGAFGRKSWLAGWTDADAGLIADAECVRLDVCADNEMFVAVEVLKGTMYQEEGQQAIEVLNGTRRED